MRREALFDGDKVFITFAALFYTHTMSLDGRSSARGRERDFSLPTAPLPFPRSIKSSSTMSVISFAFMREQGQLLYFGFPFFRTHPL